MILYHGSSKLFNFFRTPTGAEEMDVVKGGVIYFLASRDEALRLYGRKGYVYTVDVKTPVSYADQRAMQGLAPKKGKYTRGVYVSLARDCSIINIEQ